jgi:hypothetical protein
MRILVDRFIYQGFAMRQGDTPHLISPNAGLLQDQDEKRSVFDLLIDFDNSSRQPSKVLRVEAAFAAEGGGQPSAWLRNPIAMDFSVIGIRDAVLSYHGMPE